MADSEQSWRTSPTRRKALAHLAGLMAASPIGAAMARPDPRPRAKACPALFRRQALATLNRQEELAVADPCQLRQSPGGPLTVKTRKVCGDDERQRP